MKRIISLLLVFATILSLVSCISSFENVIIGMWNFQSCDIGGYCKTPIQIFSDGTCRVNEYPGTWSYVDNTFKLTGTLAGWFSLADEGFVGSAVVNRDELVLISTEPNGKKLSSKYIRATAGSNNNTSQQSKPNSSFAAASSNTSSLQNSSSAVNSSAIISNETVVNVESSEPSLVSYSSNQNNNNNTSTADLAMAAYKEYVSTKTHTHENYYNAKGEIGSFEIDYYSLCDFDNDNIPELIVEYEHGPQWGRKLVLTYKGGEVVFVTDCSSVYKWDNDIVCVYRHGYGCDDSCYYQNDYINNCVFRSVKDYSTGKTIYTIDINFDPKNPEASPKLTESEWNQIIKEFRGDAQNIEIQKYRFGSLEPFE